MKGKQGARRSEWQWRPSFFFFLLFSVDASTRWLLHWFAKERPHKVYMWSSVYMQVGVFHSSFSSLSLFRVVKKQTGKKKTNGRLPFRSSFFLLLLLLLERFCLLASAEVRFSSPLLFFFFSASRGYRKQNELERKKKKKRTLMYYDVLRAHTLRVRRLRLLFLVLSLFRFPFCLFVIISLSLSLCSKMLNKSALFLFFVVAVLFRFPDSLSSFFFVFFFFIHRCFFFFLDETCVLGYF